MARSLRSKRRRKLAAIKRKRYGKKELIRLKKMLGLPTGEEKNPVAEVKIENVASSDVATDAVTIEEVQQIEQPDQDQEWEEIEEDDNAEVIRAKRRHKIRKSHRPNARDARPRCVRRKEREKEGEGGEAMDHDQCRRFNRQTQRDQFGNYPVWMNQKTVRLLAKKSKKIKRLEKKQQHKQRRKTSGYSHSKRTKECDTAGVNEAIIGFQKIGVVPHSSLVHV